MGRHTLYRVWSSVLSDAACDAIVADGDALARTDAAINATHKADTVMVDGGIRRTEVAFFPESHWVNGILWHYASLANNEEWHLDIRVCPSAQYGVYPPGGHYDWHQDEFDQPYDRFSAIPLVGFNRKLSAVINLSDPGDYEGGRFRLRSPFGAEVDVPGSEARGSVIVFQSGTVHTAGRVDAGVRRSLVGWILGPSLR